MLVYRDHCEDMLEATMIATSHNHSCVALCDIHSAVCVSNPHDVGRYFWLPLPSFFLSVILSNFLLFYIPASFLCSCLVFLMQSVSVNLHAVCLSVCPSVSVCVACQAAGCNYPSKHDRESALMPLRLFTSLPPVAVLFSHPAAYRDPPPVGQWAARRGDAIREPIGRGGNGGDSASIVLNPGYLIPSGLSGALDSLDCLSGLETRFNLRDFEIERSTVAHLVTG